MSRLRLPVAALVLIVCALFFGGCAGPYSIKPTSVTKIFKERTTTALNSSQLSEFTQQKLRLMAMDTEYRAEPQAVTRQLYDEVRKTRDPELTVATAEMALLEARQLERKDAPAAAAMNLAAASLAYDYLFADQQLKPSDALKPSYRFMADVYNMASSGLVENRGLREDLWTDQPGIRALATTYDLTIHKKGGMLWNPNVFDSIKAANDIKIGGFRNAYFSRGLGAPMVGYVNDPRANPELGRYFPPKGAAFAVTAMLTFGPATEVEGGWRRKADLTFYNSVFNDYAFLHGMKVPLEADYTTPLAVLLSRIQSPDQGFEGMLHGDRYLAQTGMRMLEPWQADKIPVVMVHGLMSTPKPGSTCSTT